MHKINIESALKSPRVLFDPENHLFEIEGSSRPENVRDFYYPIIGTLKEFFEETLEQNKVEEYNKIPFKFNFKLEYFNSSSAKFIADILVMVEKYHDKGFNLKIYWYFDDGDDDMKEVGEDFSEMVDFPFNFIMVQR